MIIHLIIHALAHAHHARHIGIWFLNPGRPIITSGFFPR